jgi:hypothetical protein
MRPVTVAAELLGRTAASNARVLTAAELDKVSNPLSTHRNGGEWDNGGRLPVGVDTGWVGFSEGHPSLFDKMLHGYDVGW